MSDPEDYMGHPEEVEGVVIQHEQEEQDAGEQETGVAPEKENEVDNQEEKRDTDSGGGGGDSGDGNGGAEERDFQSRFDGFFDVYFEDSPEMRNIKDLIQNVNTKIGKGTPEENMAMQKMQYDLKTRLEIAMQERDRKMIELYMEEENKKGTDQRTAMLKYMSMESEYKQRKAEELRRAAVMGMANTLAEQEGSVEKAFNPFEFYMQQKAQSQESSGAAAMAVVNKDKVAEQTKKKKAKTRAQDYENLAQLCAQDADCQRMRDAGWNFAIIHVSPNVLECFDPAMEPSIIEVFLMLARGDATKAISFYGMENITLEIQEKIRRESITSASDMMKKFAPKRLLEIIIRSNSMGLVSGHDKSDMITRLCQKCSCTSPRLWEPDRKARLGERKDASTGDKYLYYSEVNWFYRHVNHAKELTTSLIKVRAVVCLLPRTRKNKKTKYVNGVELQQNLYLGDYIEAGFHINWWRSLEASLDRLPYSKTIPTGTVKMIAGDNLMYCFPSLIQKKDDRGTKVCIVKIRWSKTSGAGRKKQRWEHMDECGSYMEAMKDQPNYNPKGLYWCDLGMLVSLQCSVPKTERNIDFGKQEAKFKLKVNNVTIISPCGPEIGGVTSTWSEQGRDSLDDYFE